MKIPYKSRSAHHRRMECSVFPSLSTYLHWSFREFRCPWKVFLPMPSRSACGIKCYLHARGCVDLPFNSDKPVAPLICFYWGISSLVLVLSIVGTCHLSAPLVWGLTFIIFTITHLFVANIFLGIPLPLLVFAVPNSPCFGRCHQEQRDEVEALLRSFMAHIRLVIYIRSPPEELIFLSKPIHTFPPDPPIPLARKQFVFLRRKSPRGMETNGLDQVKEAETRTSGSRASIRL